MKFNRYINCLADIANTTDYVFKGAEQSKQNFYMATAKEHELKNIFETNTPPNSRQL